MMVYFLEDDDSIRKLVIYALESQGYEAEGFERPSEFWEAMSKKNPRVVLLDIMLPEEDGYSILRKLKSKHKTSDIPVIMVTAKSAEFEKVECLDEGADDYLVKPFGVMELMARIRAVLRRSEKGKDFERIEIGRLLICRDKHEVMVSGKPVQLTVKEYGLLNLLAENEEKVLSRSFLLEQIWNLGTEPENRTLDVHIRTLRSKLGDVGNYIETVRGVGYRLKAVNI